MGNAPHNLLEESVGNWVKYWTQPEPKARGDNRVSRIDAVARCLRATIDEDDMTSLTRLKESWTTARR